VAYKLGKKRDKLNNVFNLNRFSKPDMGKRLAFLLALTSINLVFAAKELTFANPNNNGLNNGKLAPSGSTVMIFEGAIVSKSTPTNTKQPKTALSYKVVDVDSVIVTGYSSTEAETDNTPFITATGKYVFPGVAASNVLPIGTKFRLPDLFGDRIFIVEDRMHSRYDGKKWVDIWFAARDKALQFGKRFSKIEILEG